MKHNYVNLQRLALMYALAVWLVVLATGLAMAQQRAEIDPGVLRFKVTEELALQLEASRLSLDANNVLLTGIQSLDRANARYKVSALQRVFRPAGKFEAKHRKYGLHRWYEVQMDKSLPVLEALDFYRVLDGIEKVEPSYKKSIIGSNRADFGPIRVSGKARAQVPLAGSANDPLLPNQWHYNNTGQAGGTPGSDISLFDAWTIETGTPNVIVAVTDGGAQVNHPDLAANMWVNTGEIPGNGLDDDNNGFVDDVNGYGFGDDTGEIAPDDHGTHTSGTIAAVTNNGVGVAGVAGGSGAGDGARIMTLATFGGVGTGGFGESYVYGADNGAVISQNSWGYNGPDFIEPSVKDGIDYFIAEAGIDENGNQVGPMRGGIVIFAAGNDNDNDKYYPGYYDKTLAVGGLNNQDKKAWYSNFGDWVDMSAPGGETFVANDPRGVLSTIANSQYAFFQGTSMACPHVSGVAALIVSKYGGNGFTPQTLRDRLTFFVDNVNAADPGFAGLLGSGRLNAFKALTPDDGTGPQAISDLTASAVGITSVTLRWTSPADVGTDPAFALDVRYATFPITSANFNSATAVASPPAPLPAGALQTYTVAALSPGTTYYFAVKSADFFGNLSAISNVLTQATNFPPQVSVSPDAITETLQTAQVATRLVTITNSGQGELTFAFGARSASDFATPSPVNGTVPSFDTLQVNVTLDANGLLPGTYHQNLILSSNDPANPSVTIPVILTVISNGKPIASIAPDSLDFGQVFVTDTTRRTATVHNAGAEPLNITAVTSSNPDFYSDFTGPITVAPFDSAVITVTYAPSALGIDTGTVSVATNDSTNATLVVHLRGEGVPAPSITVTPGSLSATLNTGRTTTRTLTISNTGGSNLEFAATIAASAPVALATVQTLTLPVSQATQQGSLQKTIGNAGYNNQVTLKSAAQSAVVANVLILSPDNNVTDIEAILDAFSDVEADVFPKASLPAITLADLTGYDVVFTTNNTQWLGSGGVQPALIGNLLADYIDAGGKVISNQFNYSYDAWKLEGRFIDDQYGPFLPSTTDAQVSVSLGDILAPGHPIMEGVSQLQYDGFVQNVTLAPGAIALAEWDDGALFLAANENVVALNLLPSLGNGDPLQFTGDLPLIYQNAIHYLSGPGFVSVSPAEGVIAAGTQLDLLVTFDATGLDSGVYEASIDIASNAPGHELVAVPATLTVLGPEFTVNPTSLTEALEKNQTSARTIVIQNNGPEATTFTVDVQGIGIGQTATEEPETAGLARLAVTRTDAGDVSLQKATQTAAADFDSEASVDVGRNGSLQLARSAIPVVLATETQYATDFENFNTGDVNGQQDWFGQFGNWTIETANAYSGSRHFRGLSDGFGTSAAISPQVPIGTEAKSTTTMKLHILGTGVTWQILPQSPTAALVNTRVQFAPNGVASALVKTASGGAAFVAFGTTPAGYFDLTIEVDRDSAYFHVYFDDTRVFTGQGFTGNIEEVVVLSGMQVAGPTLDLDDLKIIDGKKEPGVSFLNVSPLSGNLPAGTSVTLNVTFNSNDLEFGTYNANINIKVAQTKFTVPASLRVFGDPEIDVDPTYLQATVDYQEDSTRILTIQNTGGNPLNYSLQVIGAATNGAALVARQQNKAQHAADARTLEKIARDERDTRPAKQPASAIQLLTGPELLREDFEDASFPPAGWQVVDNEGTGVVWNFAAAYGEDNYAGTGEAATTSSDAAGVMEFDTELITPLIPAAGKRNITIQYNVNYQNLAGLDFLDLDIQVDGGAWRNVLRWNEDHGTLRGIGVSATIQLEDHIGAGSSFRLRWHYYDPNTDDFDWYAQIDDVVIYENPRPWLTVSPAFGTVPVQGTANIEARFNAKDVTAGNYVGGILVSSNAAEDPLVGVVAQLTVRPPASLSVTPASLYQELLVDETATQTLTIANTGASKLKFAFGDTPVPSAVVATPQERREPAYLRTTPSAEIADAAGTQAINAGITAIQASSVPLYVTGFEDFAPGDIDGQNGWAGQFGNWEIESLNAFEGANHIRSISDGLGTTRAFSPRVAIGSDPISSAALRLYAEPNVTWQVIPQSPAAGFVNTRIQISPDGTLSALVKDTLGNGVFAPVNVTLPQGYFELRIDVARATDIFTLRIDGTEVFTGQGFAGDIEQLVLFSLMEAAGPVLDVDNVAIFDGPAMAPWLTYNPKSGIVPAGGTATITVNFDATKLEAGLYTDTLTLSSNDPAHRTVNVPVTLKVLVNTPPVLAAIDTVTVIEKGSVNVTFTATDVDNEPVTVALLENLAFITLVSETNGKATYQIQPTLGDAGEYDFTVTATDARGKQDSDIFHLSVTPYGVESFTLFNTRTNRPVTTFTDTVSIDIANPELSKLTVHANTNPATVGSVKFWVNNRYENVDNTKPYALNTNVIKSLDGGYNVLLAKAYTSKNGGGSQGKSLAAVIRIVNSAAVTDFDVVKITGGKLADLAHGAVIDISKHTYKQINIKANTTGSKIKSVVFTLNGVVYRTDNLAPYQLGGLGTFIDLPWRAVPGAYKLTATPYSDVYGGGVAGQPLTINFTVVNGHRTVATQAEIDEINIAGADLLTETDAQGIRLYPVPAHDVLNVRLDEREEGYVGLVIHNAQGQQVFSDEGTTLKFEDYSVSTSRLTPGIYYVRVVYASGKQVVRKFIKA